MKKSDNTSLCLLQTGLIHRLTLITKAEQLSCNNAESDVIYIYCICLRAGKVIWFVV